MKNNSYVYVFHIYHYDKSFVINEFKNLTYKDCSSTLWIEALGESDARRHYCFYYRISYIHDLHFCFLSQSSYS